MRAIENFQNNDEMGIFLRVFVCLFYIKFQKPFSAALESKEGEKATN